MDNFRCSYSENCFTRYEEPEKCMKCENNKRRNYIEDHFVEANDSPIPKEHVEPKPFVGPIEQTEGYECPICHQHTNPYVMINGLCRHCGYRLFLKKGKNKCKNSK